MFALGQVLVDVRRVRDICIIIINMYYPNQKQVMNTLLHAVTRCHTPGRLKILNMFKTI